MSILSILAAIGLMIAETYGVSSYIRENIEWAAINDPETARGLLGTLITAGISILVFTFNMVMLLLSQAANNYSPRVLPGLISDRENQFILGVFLSFIVYNIIVYINLEPSQYYDLPLIAIIVGILLGFASIGNFVYFIHKISKSIQINNILKKVYASALDRLQHLKDRREPHQGFGNTSKWYIYNSKKDGTLQNISSSAIISAAVQFDTKILVLATKGSFVLSDVPIFKSEKELSDDQVDTILTNFNFSETELVGDNYVLGFKQISEIAIKAMSPGINDPGTAINSIDHLMVLFSKRMQLTDISVTNDSDDQPRLEVKVTKFQDLLALVFSGLRQYSKKDLSVMLKCLEGLKNLLHQPAVDDEYYDHIHKQIDLLIEDAKRNIENETDLQRLLDFAKDQEATLAEEGDEEE